MTPERLVQFKPRAILTAVGVLLGVAVLLVILWVSRRVITWVLIASFLALAMAVAALSAREVNRIVLTRPAVEAGERLGFLPGDVMAKVDPYLRPLFDALYTMLEPERVNQHLERGVI